jgi:hypothetical protein
MRDPVILEGAAVSQSYAVPPRWTSGSNVASAAELLAGLMTKAQT